MRAGYCDEIQQKTSDRFLSVLIFRNAMSRFRRSMSWSFPTEPGKPMSQSANNETPSPSAPTQSCWYSQHHDAQAGDDPLAGSGLWAQLASGRSFFLPLHYTPTYAYPLIVWFHSNGFNENQIESVMPHISLRNYVGIGIRGTRAADTMGHRFDWHTSPAAVVSAHDATCEAVDEAMRRFCIHPSRVVLAGYREGGTMAQRIALRDPEKFAGVISLGGRIPTGGMNNFTQLRRRRLPMLWQWGERNPQYTEDNVKSDCRLTMSIGADVELRQYPDDDEMNTAVLSDIDEWIMRRIVAGSSISDSQQWETTPVSYSRN